jgi:hypothetical protein
MFEIQSTILELPVDSPPDPDEFIQPVLDSRFRVETGSPVRLDRARSGVFDGGGATGPPMGAYLTAPFLPGRGSTHV